MLNQIDHLGSEQPALAHRVAQRKHALGLLCQFMNGLIGLKTLTRLKHFVNRSTHRLDKINACFVCQTTCELSSQLALHIYLVAHAKQEEVEQSRNIGFAAFGLNNLNNLVVCGWMELYKNLSNNTNARLGTVIYQRQRIECLNGFTTEVVEATALDGGEQIACTRHEGVVQSIG